MATDPRWLVPDKARPVFSLCLAFRQGASADTPGKAGLGHLTAQMAQRGAGPYSRKAFLEAIDRLGANADISVSRHETLVWIDGLARYFEPLVELVATAIAEPHHKPGELDKLRREVEAELEEVRDDDSALGGRAFARALYAGHPYARPLRGCPTSLAPVETADIRAHHAHLFAPSGLVAGLAGPLGADALAFAKDRIAPGHAQAPPLQREPVPALSRRKGLRIIAVDKPERTQTQLFIGQPTIDLHHPDWTALQVAQTAFGGMFTAPLSQEIREKRGWSYSVWSALQSDPWLGTFQIRLHPNAPDAAPALALTLELLADFQARGPSRESFEAARLNLTRGHVFTIDTANRLLWERLSTELAGLPPRWLDDTVARYGSVTHEAAIAAARAHLDPEDLTVVIVCTARDVVPQLERLPGLTDLEVLDWGFALEDPALPSA